MTNTIKEIRYESLDKYGSRLEFYIGDKFISNVDPYGKDIEAAKDFVFMTQGYDVAPIGNPFRVDEELLNDESKSRRFRFIHGVDLQKAVQHCTIVDGKVELDQEKVKCNMFAGYIEEYMEKYYLVDIQKSMKTRNMEPVVITVAPTTQEEQPANVSDPVVEEAQQSGSSTVNHTANAPTYESGNKAAEEIEIPGYYIPDDAGFDADSSFMKPVGDNNYKPNFTLVNDNSSPAISRDILNAADNFALAYNQGYNDEDAYKSFIKELIKSGVKMFLNNSPQYSTIMTDDMQISVMNYLYDAILEGSVEEVNNRLFNEANDPAYIGKLIRGFVESMTHNKADDVVVEEEVVEDPAIIAVINQPEEESILGDTPVDNTDLIAQYPVLSDVEKIMTYNGKYGIKFKKDEYGFILAAVFATDGTDDEVIESKSLILDLDGLTFNKDHKFWIDNNRNERPDFRKCYTLAPEAIVNVREGRPLGEPLFGGVLPKLNRYVDIRSLFNLVDDSEDITMAQDVLIETKKIMMPSDRIIKRYSKGRGVYTKATKVDDNTFEFTIAFEEVYPRFVGGDPLKNNGGTGNLAVKVVTSNESEETPDTK